MTPEEAYARRLRHRRLTLATVIFVLVLFTVWVVEQLTRVRDNASRLLETLGESATEGRKAVSTGVRQATAAADSAMASIKTLSTRVKPAGKKTTAKSAAAGRKMADKAHAPGKRHRKPAPTAKGVKKSDQRIVKMRTAQAARQRRKSYA